MLIFILIKWIKLKNYMIIFVRKSIINNLKIKTVLFCVFCRFHGGIQLVAVHHQQICLADGLLLRLGQRLALTQQIPLGIIHLDGQLVLAGFRGRIFKVPGEVPALFTNGNDGIYIGVGSFNDTTIIKLEILL